MTDFVNGAFRQLGGIEPIGKFMRTLSTRYPLSTFFLLVFAISWGAVLATVSFDGLPVAPEQAALAGMAILLGTSIAGISMTAIVDGKQGLKRLGSRLLEWRIDARSAALALLAAPVTTLLAVLLLRLISPGHLPALWAAEDKLSMLLTAIPAGLVVALFEELGWTGFAIPRMRQRRGILTTGLVVGLLWGAWHFILFWQRDSFSNLDAFTLLLAQLFAWLPAYRILLVYVYSRTESLFAVVIMHMALVISLFTLEPKLAGNDLLIFILLRGGLLWLLAISLISRRRSIRSISWGRPSAREGALDEGL